jgi:septum formation protein
MIPLLDFHPYPVLLASASPRRRELLGSLGIFFQVISPDIEEKQRLGEPALSYVVRNAREKAHWIESQQREPSVVIAADTVVLLGEDRVLEKPGSAKEAEEMLTQLSGVTHRVLTGMALSVGSQDKTLYERAELFTTEVEFRPLSLEEIRAYIATGEPMDKSGSYGVQGRGASFVRRLGGSYTNVCGLPLSELQLWLRELKISLFS